MTLNEFLEKLSKTRRKWYLEDGNIKSEGRNWHCPISAVTGNHWDAADPVEKGMAVLGLSRGVATRIFTASDYPDRHSIVRAKLLAAVGLKERDNA